MKLLLTINSILSPNPILFIMLIITRLFHLTFLTLIILITLLPHLFLFITLTFLKSPIQITSNMLAPNLSLLFLNLFQYLYEENH